ncbi:hypothetical protein LTR17_027009 [Elasticomyces elasticus]|nr:hypothetical protein LTR17_027009 [Elasticomyces elasticus]
MEGFATLKPSFTIRMQTSPQLVMGKGFSQAGMAVGPIDHGTVESVPGYGAEPFKGTVANGADVFYVESTFKSVRLDFRSVIRQVDPRSVRNG